MGGLNLYDSQARSYDPTLGIFTTADPLAEEDYEYSPYLYCGGNPIIYTDPDGKLFGLDNVIGAGISAVTEIGTQMVENAITGKEVTNINWKNVAVETAAGFVTSGASTVGKVAIKVGAAVVKSALNNSQDGGKAVVKGAAVELVSEVAGGAASKLAKGIGKSALNKVASNVVSSKTTSKMAVQSTLKVSSKTAKRLGDGIHAGQKAVAKEIKNANKTVANKVVSNVTQNKLREDEKKK